MVLLVSLCAVFATFLFRPRTAGGLAGGMVAVAGFLALSVWAQTRWGLGPAGGVLLLVGGAAAGFGLIYLLALAWDHGPWGVEKDLRRIEREAYDELVYIDLYHSAAADPQPEAADACVSRMMEFVDRQRRAHRRADKLAWLHAGAEANALADHMRTRPQLRALMASERWNAVERAVADLPDGCPGKVGPDDALPIVEAGRRRRMREEAEWVPPAKTRVPPAKVPSRHPVAPAPRPRP